MPTAIAPTKEAGKAKAVKPSAQQFVTKEEFGQMTDVLSTIVDKLSAIESKTETPAAGKEAEEVRKAKHDQAPINPAWDEKAHEILGELVDHCEVFYPKAGGTIFTVVVKPEFSNAPAEYMKAMGADRRSREIGNEGLAGVELWCKLVRQNLKRSAAK